jgi:hypothetical protein
MHSLANKAVPTPNALSLFNPRQQSYSSSYSCIPSFVLGYFHDPEGTPGTFRAAKAS